MNNVKKNFHTKSMLRHMADGGVVRNDGQFNGPMRAVDAMAEGRDPNEDRRAKAAEYGMAPKKNPEPNIFEKAKAKADEIRAKLGFADGGDVEGPGGPTDDKVPAMLSDGEFVLPADTVKHIGVEHLENLVAQTHKPTGKSPLRGMADGGLVGQFIPDIEAAGPRRPSRLDPLEEHKLRVQARLQNPSGAPRAAPVAQPAPIAQPGPYPPAGPEGVEISRAEFDAARARQAGRVPADIPRSAANTLGIDEARAARAARYGEAAASRASLGARAAGLTGRLAGSALRGAGTLAAPVVMAQGFHDAANTGTDDFAKRFGVDLSKPAGGGELGEVGRDLTLRTLGAASDIVSRAGNLVGADVSSRFADKQGAQDPAMAGRINLITPDSGAIPDSALRMSKEQFAAQKANGGVTPVSDRTGDPNEVIGTINGRKITRAMSDNMGGNVQAAPQEDPIQGALRNLLRQQGGGQNIIGSREGAINNQFDALQKQIVDTYGGKAQGTMISKLLDLQKARADALGQDQGARVNSQGNVVAADNSVRGQQSSALGNMASMRNSDRTNQTSLLREQLEGIRANDAAQRAGIKDNSDNFMADIQAQTPLDKDGNPVAGFRPDEVMARLAKTNPGAMNMDRGPRSQLIASTIAGMKSGQNFDNTRGFMGVKDSTATPTGIFKNETNPMDTLALMSGGIGMTSIANHMLFPQLSDRVIQMGTDKDGNPQLAYEDDIGGDERFQQEVAKQSALRKQKDK